MSAVIAIVALVVLVFVLPTLLHGRSSGPSSGSRRNQERADQLIGQAESAMMRGQLGEAESCFSQATTLANGAPLLLSEAHYGLCRVCERKGDLQGAARQVDAALSYAPQWREYKPNYDTLLQSEKRRILDEIAKSL